MRKNGINRELQIIEGGVCAPEGYRANAVACGIREDGGLDYGIILSERRCAVACMYACGDTVGGPVKVSKKNMRYGYARAMVVNGGVANCIDEKSEKFAYSVCDLFFAYGLERTEIVIASTGKIGEPLELDPFKKNTEALLKGLAPTHENSMKVAEAIRTESVLPKQVSFSFDLGDYPCKIGAVFKGGAKTSPNMATFLAFLTTDVSISSPMLQKALESAVRETFNQLNIDGVESPNDTVCIFANGRAGNYKIDCEDSEYKKFVYALRSVLQRICLAVASDGAKKVLTCRVRGARSKEEARAIAKAVVGLHTVKQSLLQNQIDVEPIFYTAVNNAKRAVKMENIHIAVRSEKGAFCLYEEYVKFNPSQELLENIFSAFEIEIEVKFRGGNYSAIAYGRI